METAGPSITYRKIFKTSYPEFTEIKVLQSGSGTYDIRQLDDDPNPQPFTISLALAAHIFGLSEKLHNFQNIELDVHRRVANLGQKTFRYQRGSETHEVAFNYTLDPNATQLFQIFEGLGRQASDLDDLQRTMRYDHLGVNDVLLHIEADLNNRALPEPDELLPSLDKVASDSMYLDLARQRARSLAERIRGSR